MSSTNVLGLDVGRLYAVILWADGMCQRFAKGLATHRVKTTPKMVPQNCVPLQRWGEIGKNKEENGSATLAQQGLACAEPLWLPNPCFNIVKSAPGKWGRRRRGSGSF